MQKTIFGLIIALFALSIFFMTTSFGAFSAEITRSSTVNVTADTESVIQLTPNSSYDMVALDNEGKLTTSPSNLGADSVNRNMYLQIGDPTNPQSDYAFTITSLADRTTVLNITLQPSPEYSSTADSVVYTIQQSDGTKQTISANGTTQTFILNPTETLYVAVEIDTVNENAGNLNTTLIIESETQ